MAIKRKTLEDLKLLRTMSTDVLDVLAEKIEKKYLNNGDILFNAGDVSNSLYIINKGSVEVYKEFDADVTLSFATLHSGELFGEMALIDEFPRSASIRALEDCEFLILTKENFEDIIESHPEKALDLLIRLAKVMSLRIRKTNQNLEDYYFLCRGLITSDKFREIYKSIIT